MISLAVTGFLGFGVFETCLLFVEHMHMGFFSMWIPSWTELNFCFLQVVALGISQAVKCVTALLLVLAFPHWGIYSFSLAQILSSVSYAAIYYFYFAHYISSRRKKDDCDNFPCSSMADLLPQAIPGKVSSISSMLDVFGLGWQSFWSWMSGDSVCGVSCSTIWKQKLWS